MWRCWAKVVDLKRCLRERRVDSRVEISVSDGVVLWVDREVWARAGRRLEAFFLRFRFGLVTVVQVLFMVRIRLKSKGWDCGMRAWRRVGGVIELVRALKKDIRWFGE